MVSPETVQRALKLIKRAADNEYFFNRLQSPDWIEPLLEAGMFKNPYQPIEEGQYIRFPLWPESQYLARMASYAPEIVLKAILQVPETRNVRVHEDFATAALAMPVDFSAMLVPKAIEWLKSLYQLLLPEKLGQLVAHLAQGGQIKPALDLAQSLLALLPDPQSAKEQETEYEELQPYPLFKSWEYEQILQENIPVLVAAAGEQALSLLADVLETAIKYSRREIDPDKPQDNSFLWRPAIEDHEQNTLPNLTSHLVVAVRNAAEQICSSDPSQVPSVIDLLEARPWPVFKRIVLHLLRLYAEGHLQLIVARLTDHNYFDDPNLRHEYNLLMQSCFKALSPQQQQIILGWIDQGTDLEDIKQFRAKRSGEQVTDEEARQTANYLRLERLAPIKDALPSEWQQRYQKFVKRFGEPEHPDFLVYSSGVFWGPTSPVASADIAAMTTEELIEYLRTWQPPNDPLGPSIEGMARELQVAVAQQPERFVAAADQFKQLDATYVRVLFTGLRDAIKRQRTFDWRPVLELSHWVLQQPREIPRPTEQLYEADPDWSWTLDAISNLLYEGYSPSPCAIPFELQAETWAILEPLTNDPSPTPEYEAKYGGSNMDPPTLSLNTIRGHAMHTLIRYAQWLHRNLEQQAIPEADRQTHGGMTEVFAILDSHLNPTQDSSLAIRSIYGWYFPKLVWLDRDWSVRHTSAIFPEDPALLSLYEAAWDTYLKFNRAQNILFVFDTLQGQYQRAITRVSQDNTNTVNFPVSDQRLLEHLMILYVHGKIELTDEDSLLTQFYNLATDRLCAHALVFLGQELVNVTDIDPQFLARVKTLWEARLEEAKRSQAIELHAKELATFGWLFASGKYEDDWSIQQLADVSRLIGTIDPYHLVVKRLSSLATTMPLQVIETLVLLVRGRQKEYSWPQEVRQVVRAVMESTDVGAKQKAEEFIHWLGARGEHYLRDLLPTDQNPSGR